MEVVFEKSLNSTGMMRTLRSPDIGLGIEKSEEDIKKSPPKLRFSELKRAIGDRLLHSIT